MPKRRVKLVTFNICGIKGILSRSAQWVPNRSLESMFHELKADIICFQETKIQSQDITKDLAVVPHYNSYFSSSVTKKGYSGVAIYVHESIRVHSAEEGLTGMLLTGPPGKKGTYKSKASSLGDSIYPDVTETYGRRMDDQGRAITLDLGSCVVIGLYCPADSQGNMEDYRTEFFQLLDWRVTKLREAGREVIVLGDLNVAREPRDSAPLRDEMKRLKQDIDTEVWKYGTVPRKAVNDWVENWGMIDTSRYIHPERLHMYTCWDQAKNCRPANFGSRIDYILVSEGLKCEDADILPDLVGSDHCPVYADVMLDVEPQKGHRIPYLSRSLADRWNGGIKSFFKSLSSPSPILPSEEDFRESKPSKDEEVAAYTPIAQSQDKPPSKTTSTTIPLGVPQSPEKMPGKQLSLSTFFGANDSRWQKVNQRLKPPLCEHNEPCILKRSTKPPRKGEYFWLCNRSMGGKNDKSGEFRCRTFIWDSERS